MHTSTEEGVPLLGAMMRPLIEATSTGDAIEVFRLDLQPEARSPKHSLASWKLFVVLEGSVIIAEEETERRRTAGDVVFVPGGRLHFYRNDSGAPAVLVVVTAGVEQLAFLRGISTLAAAGPIDPERLTVLAHRHGVRLAPTPH